MSWLQPVPDTLVGPGPADPSSIANGQPAAAGYHRAPDGTYQGYGVVVLTVTSAGISHIVSFGDPALLPKFGFPATLPAVVAG